MEESRHKEAALFSGLTRNTMPKNLSLSKTLQATKENFGIVFSQAQSELCRIQDNSDQGAHYTSYAFIQKLKDEEFVQSMSRRGNCWDNAPQESFFGHMKDEICEAVAGCIIFEDVVAKVDDWIDYYNNDRYQWDLLKLSPKEYYQYLQTGVYPLPVYDPKKQ